jgi:hypothetical protein
MRLDGYSAPIVRVYADCVDLLLQNIARHFMFAALDREGVFDWETLKLSELGQLRQENIRIIAQTIGDVSGMTELALERVMTKALAENLPELLQGVDAGILSAPSLGLSESMQGILRYYSNQAVRQYNLVNTIMLTSSENAMRRVISTVARTQVFLRDVAQGALNTATGEVITGISGRQAAVRGAIRQMAQDGIVGFVDKGGHLWSPEAYINMDVRTTAGNVAREAVFQQNREYGVDLVIVPVNATARPKCAPYQGKVISMSNGSGYTTDRDGNRVEYMPVGHTTYGEPDGLWGINCHHSPPDPFIPGVSRQHDKPRNGIEERYEATQKQRNNEREVRNAKRVAACHDAAGDIEAFQQAAKTVKDRTSQLKAFCIQNHLPYYGDRVQVYGYGRSQASKATWAARRN